MIKQKITRMDIFVIALIFIAWLSAALPPSSDGPSPQSLGFSEVLSLQAFALGGLFP